MDQLNQALQLCSRRDYQWLKGRNEVKRYVLFTPEKKRRIQERIMLLRKKTDFPNMEATLQHTMDVTMWLWHPVYNDEIWKEFIKLLKEHKEQVRINNKFPIPSFVIMNAFFAFTISAEVLLFRLKHSSSSGAQRIGRRLKVIMKTQRERFKAEGYCGTVSTRDSFISF